MAIPGERMECPRCGSEKIVKGRIFNQTDYVSPQAFFRPKGLKPFSLFGINVRVKRNKFAACGKCGLVWAGIDTEELTKVVAESGRKNIKKILGAKKKGIEEDSEEEVEEKTEKGLEE